MTGTEFRLRWAERIARSPFMSADYFRYGRPFLMHLIHASGRKAGTDRLHRAYRARRR